MLRDAGRHPANAVGIGLPEWPRFRALVDDTEGPLRRLGVAVWYVAEDGSVETRRRSGSGGARASGAALSFSAYSHPHS